MARRPGGDESFWLVYSAEHVHRLEALRTPDGKRAVNSKRLRTHVNVPSLCVRSRAMCGRFGHVSIS